MESKIFCIGFNKTGTTSLDKLFQTWGMTSFHGEYHEKHFDDEIFKKFRCFSDGEYHDFKGLDKAFDGSKFILNTRRIDDWLISRIKHVEYSKNNSLSKGWMRKEYEKNPKAALQNWINRRVEYYKDVLDYFSGRDEDFLMVNVCDCQNQKALISSISLFLGIDDFGVKEFPRENISDQRKGPGLRKKVKSFFSKSYKARNEREIRAEVYDALRISGLPESKWRSDGTPSWSER